MAADRIQISVKVPPIVGDLLRELQTHYAKGRALETPLSQAQAIEIAVKGAAHEAGISVNPANRASKGHS